RLPDAWMDRRRDKPLPSRPHQSLSGFRNGRFLFRSRSSNVSEGRPPERAANDISTWKEICTASCPTVGLLTTGYLKILILTRSEPFANSHLAVGNAPRLRV